MKLHATTAVCFACAVLTIAVCTAQAAGRQLDPGTSLRLAQALEQAGEYERAIPIYRDLYLSAPDNIVYFDGLRRVLMQVKRYDDAIALVRQKLTADPNDAHLRCVLGDIYYKAGREQDAMAVWDGVLAADPSAPGVYRMVANFMMENRLLDKTAEVYRRARVACHDPNLFTAELAQLLSVTMDYRGATAEYIRWLRVNPGQLSYVEGRLSQFTGKKDARDAALAAVEEARTGGGTPLLDQLLAWLQLEGKEYAKAFATYREIDRATNAQGGVIYGFADRAFKDGAFATAAEAYRAALDAPLPSARKPYAEYGYACSLKELKAAADTAAGASLGRSTPVNESQPDYGGAISSFRSIIAAYPHTEFSAKSYYQIGMIEFRNYFDLDGALDAFRHVGEEVAGVSVLRFDVALRIAAVYTAKGDTGRAASELRTVADAPGATPDQSDEAAFRLAELDYFGGKFAEAIDRLKAITLNLKADYANDALQLLGFLRENTRTAAPALPLFARADFLSRQRKNTEAISLYQQVTREFPGSPIVDDALMKIAELQTDAGLFTEALGSYTRLLTEYKESGVGLDRAQYRVAELYQFALKDRQRALQAYEQLLSDFPGSVLVNQARERIRQLRGDAM